VQPRDPLLLQERLPEIVPETGQAIVENTQVNTDPLQPRQNEPALIEKTQTDPATEDEGNVVPDKPDELELALSAIAEYETQLQHNSLVPLAEDAHLLPQELRRLQARDDYRVLYSTTWNQDIPDRTKPTPILIQAGERNYGLFELEGTIAITLGRYLHANVELWLHDMNEIELLASANQQPGQQDIQWMQLNESRRMRSTELHYLDHPKFGVLIKIEPVEVPAQIDELWKKAHSPTDAVEINNKF
jgi:hypothetical protein